MTVTKRDQEATNVLAWHNGDVSQQLTWHVGDVIRKLREENDEGALEFAARADVDKDRLRKIEKGAANHTLATLAKIAAALGTDVATLHALVPAPRQHTPPAKVENDPLAPLCDAVRLAYGDDAFRPFLDALWARFGERAEPRPASARTPAPPPDPEGATSQTDAADAPAAPQRVPGQRTKPAPARRG
jgi:transcriptional regulator with XRE-family HTH domain